MNLFISFDWDDRDQINGFSGHAGKPARECFEPPGYFMTIRSTVTSRSRMRSWEKSGSRR